MRRLLQNGCRRQAFPLGVRSFHESLQLLRERIGGALQAGEGVGAFASRTWHQQPPLSGTPAAAAAASAAAAAPRAACRALSSSSSTHGSSGNGGICVEHKASSPALLKSSSSDWATASSGRATSSSGRMMSAWPAMGLAAAAAASVACTEEAEDEVSEKQGTLRQYFVAESANKSQWQATATSPAGEGGSTGRREYPATLSDEFLGEIRAIVGTERVVVDEGERRFHAKPWNSYHPIAALPGAVIFPQSAQEVSAILQCCVRHHVPITPFAGGTSIEGHTTTPFAGVTLNMSLMKEVKAINKADMDVVLQPGVGWMELNEILKPHGVFFPLDPGPGAHIGGMCATRCSGSLAVRYGTMRDNVIALEVVLPSGAIVKTSSRARKSAAGYDLTRLFIGSEGTLGIITEVTVKVQNIPEASAVAMCSFAAVEDAADVAIAAMQKGIQVSRVELLDEVMMSAINSANGFDYAEAPTLMFELVGSDTHVKEQVERVAEIVKAHGGSNFIFAHGEEEKAELWRARKEALWAAATVRPGTEALITDVCVPLSRLAELISESKKELDKSELFCPIVAHAGDGNFHVCIFLDPSKKDEIEEAKRLARSMTDRAIEMGGTCTGEHGVGTGKIEYLEKELGINAVETMARLKKALDPTNIMNPGKILPRHVCS